MQDLMRLGGIGKKDCKIVDCFEEIDAHVLLFLFFCGIFHIVLVKT
jgi:hypothetical protein